MKKEQKEILLEILTKEDPQKTTRLDSVQLRESAGATGIVLGVLAGFSDSGEPHVIFPGAESTDPVAALTVVALDNQAVGRTVALQFEGGDPARPVILGLLQSPAQNMQPKASTAGEARSVDVELDGKRLVFTAEKEIVLRCGKSSITLTRAGKVLIRGAYLLSRSSGVNRIKGGSVQIN
jgi:hypothetical protein